MDKPPYAVPSMAEIAALPSNGLTVASTFSGCGGSSLGYRMAGYRVLWANEFVPAARDTYRANAAPYTHLNDQDIRTVTPADLLDQAGISAGELDILDGSPPCASFSTAGKREAGWGKSKKYSDTEQRTDDLFYEYARLLRGVQPKVFVAENVSGLVKGTAKGYFLRILAELRGCGYQVSAKLLDAQWLGVPQMRQRLIFVGVRNDLGQQPVHPTPLPYRYTVAEALPHILSYGTMPPYADYAAAGRRIASTMRPSDSGSALAIMAAGPLGGAGCVVDAPLTFPPSVVVAQGDNGVNYKQPGAMRPVDRPSPTILASPNSNGGGHRRPSSEVHARLVHDTSGQFSAGDVTDQPCPTVLVGPNALNSRHYQMRNSGTHLDPETGKNLTVQRSSGVDTSLTARRLSLGELRRICGFPDDFVLTGTYEQRWERLGRAVPPVMMAAVAATIRDRILSNVEAAA